MTTNSIIKGTITDVRVTPRDLPMAFGLDVAMRVAQFAGWRTVRSSPLSQSLVLMKYQMNRREPRRERVTNSGQSRTRRWSAERRRVSAFVYQQAIRVCSCFREGRNQLVWSSSEYIQNPGTVRPVCPTNTRRQRLNYSEAA